MDIMTPQTLWKDFTPLPFNETVVKSAPFNGGTLTEFYFSGIKTDDGIVRIYAKYLDKGSLPTVIIFDEDSKTDITDYQGYNVMTVNYKGAVPGRRGTMYPDSLRDATERSAGDGLDPAKHRWYAWAAVGMCAALYAKTKGNGKVAVVGIGDGAGIVWKLSATVQVDAGVSIYGYEEQSDDINYKACLYNKAYTSMLRFPVLEIISSNEENDSTEYMSELFSLIQRDDCRLTINERSSHDIGEVGLSETGKWLNKHLTGEGENIPSMPTIKPYVAEGKLYFEITGEGELSLFVSAGNENCRVRNWSKADIERSGNSYFGRLPVYRSDEKLLAFVTQFKDGYKFSSPMVKRIPAKMGVAEEALDSRLVYSGDMGVDDWFGDEIVMKKGPYGIHGVATTGRMETFKIGDIRFKGPADASLRIMFYSPENQTVKFSVRDGADEYEYSIAVREKMNWVNVCLSVNNFSHDGDTLDGWCDVTSLSVQAAGGVVVASVLWI